MTHLQGASYFPLPFYFLFLFLESLKAAPLFQLPSLHSPANLFPISNLLSFIFPNNLYPGKLWSNCSVPTKIRPIAWWGVWKDLWGAPDFLCISLPKLFAVSCLLTTLIFSLYSASFFLSTHNLPFSCLPIFRYINLLTSFIIPSFSIMGIQSWL